MIVDGIQLLYDEGDTMDTYMITFGEYVGWWVDQDDALFYHPLDETWLEGIHCILPRDKKDFEAAHPAWTNA